MPNRKSNTSGRIIATSAISAPLRPPSAYFSSQSVSTVTPFSRPSESGKAVLRRQHHDGHGHAKRYFQGLRVLQRQPRKFGQVTGSRTPPESATGCAASASTRRFHTTPVPPPSLRQAARSQTARQATAAAPETRPERLPASSRPLPGCAPPRTAAESPDPAQPRARGFRAVPASHG